MLRLNRPVDTLERDSSVGRDDARIVQEPCELAVAVAGSPIRRENRPDE